MGDRLGTLGAGDKNQSWAPLWEQVSQADGTNYFLGIQVLGKSGVCSGQPEYRLHEWAQPGGAMKMAKSCKEGTTGN